MADSNVLDRFHAAMANLREKTWQPQQAETANNGVPAKGLVTEMICAMGDLEMISQLLAEEFVQQQQKIKRLEKSAG